jgi:Rad3-related DNA helicase
MSKTQSVEEAVEQAFPAPGFRKYQKKAITEIVEGFTVEDKDVILLNAPTGSGKSLVDFTASVASANDFFITTPLNSLVDQLEEDEFIGDKVITIKGRNNYECIHPEDEGTPVNEAICQRKSSFECDRKEQCPYYGRKYEALEHPQVVTNMSYIMAEGMIPGDNEWSFDDRDVLVVDECQKLEDFAMNFISFTVSKFTVPSNVWQNVSIPDEEVENDMGALCDWVRNEVLGAVQAERERLDMVPTLTKDENDDLEKLQQFELRVENFLEDVRSNDWVAQIKTQIRKNKDNIEKVSFKPVEIGRFLDSLLWSRGVSILLSSATIPGGSWMEEMGLGEANTKKINVPSTFPVENRPIITDHAVGKMTKAKRDKNMWPMAQKIMQIANHHEGEKGFVHCRSYAIAEALKRSWNNHNCGSWARENVMIQDRYNREESLAKWHNSDKPVFLSVAMDEGVDLDGDKCRWQVLAKTLYKHMGDKRTRYRVLVRGKCQVCDHAEEFWDEDIPNECPNCTSSGFGGEWDWYNRHAAIQIQQAYGRAVRGPEDHAIFYILDESAIGLIRRNAELFNEWFLEAIDDMRIDPSRGN